MSILGAVSVRAQEESTFPVAVPLPSDFQIPGVGAPRALRLIDAQGRPLQGSFSDVQWENKGDGLFFTRRIGAERNIWRAFPDPQDKARYATWRALPVTQFAPPLFAAGAVPLPRDRAILVVTNAANPNRAPQIARYDWRAASLRALTDFDEGALEAAPSPDGEMVAFSAAKGEASSVYVQSLRGGAPRRVARGARRAVWQDSATLLLESVSNGTIFRLSLSDASRPLPLARGAQISATRDGRLLSLCARATSAETASNAPNSDVATQLYLLAGDGSGLRVLAGTEGAQNPAFSADGRTLAFDAPLPGAASGRALWILPLERPDARLAQHFGDGEPLPMAPNAIPGDAGHRSEVENPQFQGNARLLESKQTRLAAPGLQISGTTSQNGALAILGTITGENVSATLEFGAGISPTRWTAIPIALPRTAGQPLALWMPPSGASGVWSLRLSVLNAGGAAQSVVTVNLPLNASPQIPKPVAAPINPVLPPGGPLPRLPLPDLPLAPVFPPQLPPLALPAPAPVSKATPKPSPAPRPVPTSRPVPVSPLFSVPTSRPVPTSIPPVLPSAPIPNRVNSASPREVGRDAASFNVSGTLATLAPGQTMHVTFWALNQGDRIWESGKATSAVRLVARWVDFESNNRRKWSLQWMKSPVAPGQRTSWSFDVTAPPQTGRFKLIYGLVRVENGWAPPAYNARQESWPGEFAAIAFAVNVK